MKSLIFVCAMLLCISFVAASHPLGIQHKMIGTWQTNGQTFSQWDITITNYATRNIKQIVIGTDATCRLRDNSSIWNINIVQGNFIDFVTLPSHQDINAGASYTFGYIIYGAAPANLFVKAVIYA
ncbi:cellulose-binding domain-containing protein [Cavenderia fasciculata]|uniref:Cellulose-binding domain-containing protein n=1 Tax=Cavenderia fasciculata TaxID=261658 RepID=F4Q7K5_CACFS|nr:cellulose-binding domain-containing protein [Cavenderia fasciculata]EGG16387.1 cellulose-binding domain-containing protein [Cavenderia fasciculata]|eukprot:XP_004354771.1 cellulose-binding domain-containing protein [Cavenderia fasciculata]